MEQTPSVALKGRLRQVSVVADASSPGRALAGGNAGAAQATDELHEERRLLEKERGDLKLARLALESGLQRVNRLESQWAGQAHQQIVDLALAIAARVLMQEIRAQRHEIDPIVEAVLARAPSGQDIVVRMHPEDIARCDLARKLAAGQAGGAGESLGTDGMRFVADSTVKRAECIVDTPQGFVRTDVESHLRELGEALRSSE
jgi:flagellar biosynthesis/type III secretory pathway protein FliH